MNATLYPAAALLAWTIVLWSVRRLPAMLSQPAQLAAWTLNLFFALIFTVGWSVVWKRLDAWTGLPESNTLIAMCLVVCYSASAMILLQLWSYTPHRARRRAKATIPVVVAVLITMVTLFVRSDASHHRQQSFTAWYAGSVEYQVYLLIYLATYTATEIEVIRLCRRYAKLTTRGWLRRGLATASTGAAIGLLYTVTRATDIVAARAGVDLYRWENVAELGAGLGALLVMLGLTVPSWGPRISVLTQRVRRLLAYVRLRPLWSRFYALDPSIAFDDQRADGAGPIRRRLRSAVLVLGDPEYHIARRVVEIRDGILSLRPYQDPVVAQRAREYHAACGLCADDLDAAVTAAQIRAALETQATTPRRSQPQDSAIGNTPADLDAEIAWLLKVTENVAKAAAHPELLPSPDPTPAGGSP